LKIWNVAGKTVGFIIASLLAFPIGVAFLMWLADGPNRGRFDEAHVFSARYITSVIVFIAAMIPFFAVANRRKESQPITWGEAMVGATYSFFLLFWLYGVVPHEFLNWADAELGWRPDMKIIGPEGTWDWLGTGGLWTAIPLTITKQTLRDFMAVAIYGVGLGGFIWVCWFWNNRAKAPAAVEPTSSYGRPLVAKAKG